jgi:aspartate aminotransferase
MSGPILQLNLNLRGRKPSATVAINERSDALRAEGREVFKLGLGQSPFPVLPAAVDALRRDAHQKDYLPVQGLPRLREALAADEGRLHGMDWDASQVVVGPGTKELMFLLQVALSSDLLLPSASWVSYGPQARILGRQVHFLDTRVDEGWLLSPEVLDDHCQQDPGRPRLLILNSPSNPTGVAYSQAQLVELARVCRRHGVLVLSDEIYGRLHFGGSNPSIVPLYPEGSVLSTGLSKWAGAGGWRMGAFLFPRQLQALQGAVTAAASETYTSVSAPIQHASVAAYADTPERDRYLADSLRTLRALGPRLARLLRGAGARVAEPDGGFYLFADLEGIGPYLRERGLRTSEQLCESLLDDTGVAVLPGSQFGRPEQELSLRLAYVDFDGAEALRALAGTEGELSEEDIRALCPRTFEAIERMAQWLG